MKTIRLFVMTLLVSKPICVSYAASLNAALNLYPYLLSEISTLLTLREFGIAFGRLTYIKSKPGRSPNPPQ